MRCRQPGTKSSTWTSAWTAQHRGDLGAEGRGRAHLPGQGVLTWPGRLPDLRPASLPRMGVGLEPGLHGCALRLAEAERPLHGEKPAWGVGCGAGPA